MIMPTKDQEDDAKGGSGLLSGLKHAFGFGEPKHNQMSEEQLKSIVDGNDELLDDEKRMISEILELDDLTVSDIMQPRVDIIAVEETETVRQALERMQGTGYSRLPVYRDDLDHIVGFVHYKDLIPPVLDGKVDAPISEFAHEALFVPETKDLFPLLSEMQTNRQQMAIVVDEYGGTDGLITIEDIVEEIVGEIIDETDADVPFVTQLSDCEWIADGRCPVEDALEFGWPVVVSDEYETIAGWLLDTMGVVPRLGDTFEIDGYSFKVRTMRRRRIQSVGVKRLDVSREDSELEV